MFGCRSWPHLPKPSALHRRVAAARRASSEHGPSLTLLLPLLLLLGILPHAGPSAVTLLLDRLQRAIADRYTIVRELGHGGMATVYLAEDIRNSRQVAVKVLGPELANAIGTERFVREIEIAARLLHPHIVPLFESGEADGLLYYVMPLIEGESLRSRLAREGALPVEDAVGIARDVGGALTFAHQHGFVHRDLKPENILLQAGTAYLADFGIALAVQDQERLTNTGLSLGTPAYMSPEQASGDRRVDERSDIYSLGSVVYEMLAGDPPFEGSPRVVVARIMTEKPVRLGAIRPTIPEAMSEVVGRAMAKMPADRFRTADEFVRALAQAQAQPGRSRWPRLRLPRRWWTYALGAGAAASLLLSVLARLPPLGTELPSGPRVDRQLTYSGDAWAASLSPDGRKVAYLADHFTALVVRDLETGDSSVLVRNPGRLSFVNGGAEWSRDGSQLLYMGHHPGGGGTAHYLIPVRGGKPGIVAMNNAGLSFGPDDTTYVSHYQAAYYIGSSPTTFQILPNDSIVGDGTIIDLKREFAFIFNARVSPDGRWIASIASRPGGEVVLLTVRQDGRHNIVVGELGVPGSAVDDWFRPPVLVEGCENHLLSPAARPELERVECRHRSQDRSRHRSTADRRRAASLRTVVRRLRGRVAASCTPVVPRQLSSTGSAWVRRERWSRPLRSPSEPPCTPDRTCRPMVLGWLTSARTRMERPMCFWCRSTEARSGG
jgi:serine/threonine protein kinase